MELTKEEKDQIKNEIPEEINKILKDNQLPYRMDQVSVMNSSNKISFLGNVRVHDPEKLKNVQKQIENYLGKYGNVVMNTREVVPCCEPPYTYINFHITYLKD